MPFTCMTRGLLLLLPGLPLPPPLLHFDSALTGLTDSRLLLLVLLRLKLVFRVRPFSLRT